MSKAAVLVKIMLGETGEPDQDYDHNLMDKVVNDLERAGFPGARHREFDKYQGVYMFVPQIGKFWLSYDSGLPNLIPEEDPKNFEQNAVTEIPLIGMDGEVDSFSLIEWIKDRYGIKMEIAKADAAAGDFIDQALAGKRPRRASTRRGV